MSVLEHKYPLRSEMHSWLRSEISEVAYQQTEVFFSDYDKKFASKEYQEAMDAFNDIFKAMVKKADQRKFFSNDEKEQLVNKFATTLQAYYDAVVKSDSERLKSYEGGAGDDSEQPKDQENIVKETINVIKELEEKLEQNNFKDDEEKQQIEEELDYLQERYQFFRSEIASGRHPTAASLSDQDKHEHHTLVDRFQRGQKNEFNATEIASSVVDQYEKKLIAHKIMIGLEAKYSPEEITQHLEEVLPNKDVHEIQTVIIEIQADMQEKKNEPVNTLAVYRRVLEVVFKDNKAAAMSFAGGAALLGILAPQMARSLGEFGRTGNRLDAVGGAGFGIMSAFAQAELDRRLGSFMNRRLFSETGIAQSICASVIQSSPELFSKNDHALIRRYVDESILNIDEAATATVEGVAVRISQIIGLASAMALRLRNPTLFAPVVIATALNTAIALKGGKEISQADQEVRQASAAFFTGLDEAMSLRQTRGKASESDLAILSRVEQTKQKLINTIAKYKKAGGMILPTVLLMNAFCMDTSDPDFFAQFAEASMYSMQLSTELSALAQELGQMRRTLRPIVELTNLTREFQENGDVEPIDWKIDLVDIKRKALTVPKCTISPGETLVVVGESGSGKSTLIEAVYGFEVERGLLMVDDTTAKNLNRRRYREGFMVSNQFPVIESKSIKENIVGSEIPFEEEVFQACLQEFGFDADWFARVNAKNESGKAKTSQDLILNMDAELSGGEKKRLSLMEIEYRLQVAPDTVKVIVLDEPTSGIDEANKPLIFELIKKWKTDHPGKTIIIVNHDEHLFNALDDENVRILGIEKSTGILAQDETLAQARIHEDAPFKKVFG
ncbi:ATP-binding cassette domain-containing protein [Patescibacteria group bacterium]|nr:ATP-binding cassette domain-containing protein [Patescibacteria group bacterium]